MFKCTYKELMGTYKNVYRISSRDYTFIEGAIDTLKPIAYNLGIYGLNYKVYHYEYNICFCVGDRPQGNLVLTQAQLDYIDKVIKEERRLNNVGIISYQRYCMTMQIELKNMIKMNDYIYG